MNAFLLVSNGIRITLQLFLISSDTKGTSF
jgi:hypothetical protein